MHQKHKFSTTQNSQVYSRLLRHPASKQKGPSLILALCDLLTYILTHILTAPGPTRGT